MKPRINMITLGVRDLDRATIFYEHGLGFPKMTVHEDADIRFFTLNGTWLALYPWDCLSQDVGVDSSSSGFRGTAFAHCVNHQDQVAELLEQAKQAGAEIVKPAQKTEWGGFSGYFLDPDKHLWEVVYSNFLWPGPKDS